MSIYVFLKCESIMCMQLTGPQLKRSILEGIIRDDEGYQSGTTAIVCLLTGEQLVVANAGDSRCVLSSGGNAFPGNPSTL